MVLPAPLAEQAQISPRSIDKSMPRREPPPLERGRSWRLACFIKLSAHLPSCSYAARRRGCATPKANRPGDE